MTLMTHEQASLDTELDTLDAEKILQLSGARRAEIRSPVHNIHCRMPLRKQAFFISRGKRCHKPNVLHRFKRII